MTTPNPDVTGFTAQGAGGGASLLAALEEQAAQAAGVPPAALIAQLASQFFAALPGQAAVPPPAPGDLLPSQLPALPDAPPASALALNLPQHGATVPQLPQISQLSLPPAPAPSLPLPGLPDAGAAAAHLPSAGFVPLPPGVASHLPAGLPVQPPPLLAGEVDLAAVPSSLGGVMALVRPLPAAAGAFGAVPTELPAGSQYFVQEALAVAGTAEAPFAFGTLALRPESTAYSPDRIPEIGFTPRPFDPNAIRRDFPILQERVHGKRLVWLDNGATTQKPQAVIDRLSYFYEHENSNIHRGAHALAARATDAYEAARDKVRRYLNAGAPQEIIFVRGATEGINLVAKSWGAHNIGKDDEIVITWLEHHANIVPWQQLALEKGARLRVVPVDDSGQVILEAYEQLLGPRTKLVAITQVSNALGTITPVQVMAAAAHRHGAYVLVDGAQAVSHMPVDVQALGADFYVFSGHKVFAPTGIGAVYGRKEVLDHTPPWQGGGNMIADVTFERTLFQPAPARFEAGTGNIADAVGLGAALDYVSSIGLENISQYEHELLRYATAGLQTVPGLRLIGTAKEKAGVLSFVLNDVRTEDVGKALDQEGIAVRAGHHCAQPILRRFGVESTVRASLAPYNTCEDIDHLVAVLHRISDQRRATRGTPGY